MEELNILQKMSAITSELGLVVKNLTVQKTQKDSYKAVSERDILDAVKPLEEKYGIYSYPHSREIIESDLLESEKEYNGVKSKTISKYMRIKITYRFVNINDKNDYIEIISYGDGIDTGDKAPGKAMTYADKYALMKAYKISTGDDPDQEASPENGYQKKESKATEEQINYIKDLYEKHDELLQYFGIDRFEDLTVNQASDLIKRKKNNNE